MGGDTLDLITEHGRAIAAAVDADPDAPVPGCPGWRLRDLAGHVAMVCELWADVVRADGDIAGPIGTVAAPDERITAILRANLDELVDVLRTHPPDTPAWTWWGEGTARSIPRRVLHEMAIHRIDADRALGGPARLDLATAVDGVREFYEVIIHLNDTAPPDVAGTVELILSDAEDRVRIATAPPAVSAAVDADDDPPDAAVTGRALDVLLALWRRVDADTLDISGDAGLARRLLAYPYLGRTLAEDA